MLVRDVAAALSAQFLGDGSLAVKRLVHPSAADKPSDLAVALSSEAFSALATSKAQVAVITETSPRPHDRIKAVIVAAQERSAFAALTALFDAGPARAAGIHETAVVAPGAVIEEGASIGPFVTVGPRSKVGARSVVLGNVSIGADVTIGAGALIYSGVRIGDRVTIGERVIIQPNAVVGGDGFSFLRPDKEKSLPGRVHSLGNVVIGDDVEIGANTTIARATLQTTRIGDGTKIDNQVQIAHNVSIGKGCLICGQVGISGSVEIGDRVLLAGGVGVADHIKIGSDAMVAAGSAVGSNVGVAAMVSGYPAMPHARTIEMITFLMRHKRVTRDLEELKSRLETIEKAAQKKD
jgi:UDP-3-O-[3-hydroxymyristoyl] glucosamine N-acyltransferase